MQAEPPAPTSASHPAVRLDRLGFVLATITAVIGAVVLIGGSELTRGADATLLVVAFAAFVGGMALLLSFRDHNRPRRLRRLGSAGTFVLLALSLLSFVALLVRTGQADSRPVITAMATGDGPLTITGNVTAGGLGSTERVAVKFVDADAVPFQAVAGTGPEVGRATIPFKVRLNGRPDRDITIVAWLVDRVTVEPSCSGTAPAVREVTCVHLALQSPTTIEPILTLTPYLSPGSRTVTVSVAAIVGPGFGVQVNLWDRDTLLQSFLARPSADGNVAASAVVPIHDDRAVLCAVADIVPKATAKTVPSPCIAATFVQMIIPSVPGFTPANSGPSANTAPAP